MGWKKHIPKSLENLSSNLSGIRMNICGNRQVVFEGSKGIVEYNEHSVKINTGKMIVAFIGRGLHIKCMNEFDLIIEGFITEIHYIL